MTAKTPIRKWCLFRGASNVRNSIRHQMKKYKMPQKDLASASNVTTARLSNYLNGNAGGLNQDQLMKVCDVLGLDVRVEVILRIEE